MKIAKKKLQNGDTEITVVFVATAKDRAELSSTGKMLKGFASGFKQVSEVEGDRINIVYGWNVEPAKRAVAPAKPQAPAVSVESTEV